jgi:putative ABC transport system permease protein
VLLRPLPFDRPEQLVKIWGRYTKQDIPQNSISEPEVWDLRDTLRSVSDIAAYNTGTGANLTRDASEPQRVTISQASAEVLPILAVKPALGRLFSADEDRPGRDHVALLDFGFWKTQMAADAAIVGRDIQLNGETYGVVGVLPDGFTLGGDANMWLPLALDRAKPNNRGNHYLEVLARLKPGVTLPQASTDLDTVARNLSAQFAPFYPKDSGFGLYLRPLQTDLVGGARLGGVIAYSVSQRTQEIGIRMVLGASRQDVLRMVVGGGLRLAIAGVLIGVALSLAAGRFISTLLFGVRATDPLTFGAVAAALLATAVFAAWIPARRATRVDPMVALRYD